MVLENLDTESKAKLFKQKPVIYTRFIFSGLVGTTVSCIEFNKNLRVLNLEGLPLTGAYVESIAKAIVFNENIKEISFQRSKIRDKGCEAICNAVKYLNNVVKLSLADCELSTKAAEFIADLIKTQTIRRFAESYQKTLCNRESNADIISGLESISLAHNEQIGDEGVNTILNMLKEDIWIKVIDMEHCGLTDQGAQLILDCLEMSPSINEFNVRGNVGISYILQSNICAKLGKENGVQKSPQAPQNERSIAEVSKANVLQIMDRKKSLKEQLALESHLRKKAELLNGKLNEKIISIENQLKSGANVRIPEGYVMMKNEYLHSIIRERNHFQKVASKVCNINKDLTSKVKTIYANVKENKLQPKYAHENVHKYTIKEIPQKVLEVQKVKSKIKYKKHKLRESPKNDISKSDHSLGNEPDVSLFFQREVYDICSSYGF